MDNGSKKIWLREYIRMEKEFERLEEDREITLAKMEHLGATVIDGMPKVSGHNGIEALLDEFIRLEAIMTKQLMMIIKRKNAMYEAINTLEESRERIVISYRYIDGMEWEDIAEKMGYSPQSVYRIHSRALNEIIIKDKSKKELNRINKSQG